MFAEERRIKMLGIIRERQKVTVRELCELFNVSSATIRTDLGRLHQSGLLIRTHGGAIQKSKMGFELDSKQREVRNLSHKRAIARAALTLIEDGDRIVIDTGTTTVELAKLLTEPRDITVITNDIEIARLLEDIESVEVILMGGFLRKRFHCTVGVAGRDICAGLTADKAFMGVNSFSLEKGATTPDINQAEAKKTMIRLANRIIILCDSSKLGGVSFAQFTDIDDIDVFVTNSIPKAMQQSLEDKGVEVIVTD